MNTEFKKRWIAALRSGEYDQTTGQLRRPSEGHCCLGVLADVISPNGWSDSQVWHGYRTEIPVTDRVIVGLSDDAMLAVMRMNDDDRMSFDQIADWIEEHL